MPFVDIAGVDSLSPIPGWSGRFVDGDNVTIIYWTIEAGAPPVHEHQHLQEEIWNVIEGEIEVTIEGVTQTAGPGCLALVPPRARHSVRPLSPARVIVIDHPKREPFGERV